MIGCDLFLALGGSVQVQTTNRGQTVGRNILNSLNSYSTSFPSFQRPKGTLVMLNDARQLPSTISISLPTIIPVSSEESPLQETSSLTILRRQVTLLSSLLASPQRLSRLAIFRAFRCTFQGIKFDVLFIDI